MKAKCSWGIIGLLLCVFAFYMGGFVANVTMIRRGQIRIVEDASDEEMAEFDSKRSRDLQQAERMAPVAPEARPSKI